MFSAAALTNLLLASAAFAAPSLESRVKRRDADRQLNTPRYLEAPANNVTSIVTRSYTNNWAGAVYENFGTFTRVSGVFTVPTVTSSGSASAWVGIDGWSCRSAILHIGVDFIYSGGQVSYRAWCQWLPDPSQYIDSIHLSAGDVVRLTVEALTLNTGTATISNISNGQSISVPINSSYPLCLQDAEWIVEDSKEQDVLLDFPKFSTVVFSDAIASTPRGNIGPEAASVVEIRQDQVLTSSSVTSFNVAIRRL